MGFFKLFTGFYGFFQLNFSLLIFSILFDNSNWQILLKIPYGKTMTYKDIARMISPSMSAQAVGSAVGHNKISILIPCHRVIGSNSSLTGYAGGIEKKEKLLEIEGIYE